jgi:hypothetical protein
MLNSPLEGWQSQTDGVFFRCLNRNTIKPILTGQTGQQKCFIDKDLVGSGSLNLFQVLASPRQLPIEKDFCPVASGVGIQFEFDTVFVLP